MCVRYSGGQGNPARSVVVREGLQEECLLLSDFVLMLQMEETVVQLTETNGTSLLKDFQHRNCCGSA